MWEEVAAPTWGVLFFFGNKSEAALGIDSLTCRRSSLSREPGQGVRLGERGHRQEDKVKSVDDGPGEAQARVKFGAVDPMHEEEQGPKGAHGGQDAIPDQFWCHSIVPNVIVRTDKSKKSSKDRLRNPAL